MKHIVYVKLSQITELTHKDVVLKDVAQVYCGDQSVMNECNSMKVITVKLDEKGRYIMSALGITRKLIEMGFTLDVNHMGEVDFIIAYEPPAPPTCVQEQTKTIFVYGICFFNTAFAIMTSSNDVSITGVFNKIFKLVMGYESGGFTVLEASYSIGPAVRIIGFFNYFASIKLSTDPTPLEVEMRLYKGSTSKTLTAGDGRKESKIDIT